MSLPRPEYPRPQFARDRWLCLNGAWEFEVDAGDSGLERGLRERTLAGAITVPFCPESVLSGVGNVDFLNAVWYRRTVEIPAEWAGCRVLLHFQAVDYDATVWVNGAEVARHQGGCVGFSCDLGDVAEPGTTAEIVVRARDDSRGAIPRGKQCPEYHSRGCDYTRTTGIWQTVWMEPEPMVALRRPRITPDVANSRFILEQPVVGRKAGHSVRALLSIGGATVSSVTVPADRDMTPTLTLPITADHVRLWAPGEPNLYDLEIELLGPDAEVVDGARSYAGLRSVVLDDKAVKINGKPVFQRLVLDQGYYPDGILTAPSDEALVADIVLSMEAGFNGARLHQKVFEERFLYHADRLGYLVWGEFADWGMDRGRPQATYVAQWLEALHRDVSHPAIVGWCGLNETHERITDRISGLDGLTQAFYLAAKAMDTSRPVLDASGYSHRIADADVYDSHDYDQDPATFKARHDALLEGKPFVNPDGNERWSVAYKGQPYFVSEFGGTWWNPAAKPGDPSWGYGQRPTTLEELYARFQGLCDALLDNPAMFGYCYTQLTDVFQEQNGIYLFDRSAKFDMSRIRAIQQRKAAIEG